MGNLNSHAMGVGTSKMQDPSGATKEYVMKEVKANKVVIFSKTYCPYCTKTKNLFLNTLKVDDTKVIELDQLSNGTTIQNTLAKLLVKGLYQMYSSVVNILVAMMTHMLHIAMVD